MSYIDYIILFFLFQFLLFFLIFFLSNYFLAANKVINNLGKKILKLKLDAISKNPILRWFKELVDSQKNFLAGSLLFMLIAIKSLGMLVIGFFGISFLVIPWIAIATSALVLEMRKKEYRVRHIYNVIIAQLISHISLAALGNYLGLIYFYQNAFMEWEDIINPLNARIIITVFFFSTIYAAWKEVSFYKLNKAIIS